MPCICFLYISYFIYNYKFNFVFKSAMLVVLQYKIYKYIYFM